ncbi:MAG: hypothetical protein ACRYG8_27875 [Janthinobacterium lividum]
MAAALDRAFLNLVTGSRRIFWGGIYPPLGGLTTSTEIYDPEHGHRVAPELHRSFDVVMLVEADLAAIKTWPIVVDEALRLLAPDGTLLLRYSKTPMFSDFALKHQLMAWTRGMIRPVAETAYAGDITQAAFRLTGPSRVEPALDGYSFGVITDGRQAHAVDTFVASVRSLKGLERISHEIVVCAPAAECARLGGQPGLKTIIQDDGFETQGWITRKKNQLVKAASFENVVIVHDRYTLAPDFLTQMQAFGADFDVLVCAQQLPDGERFPDWVTLGSAWSYSAAALLDYDDYCPHLYVNGGIMVAKRDTLVRIPWNELLFWQQAEDVELTRRMQHRGIVPRVARDVVAISNRTRPGFISGFEVLPRVTNAYPMTGTLAERGLVGIPQYHTGDRVALGQHPVASWENGVRLGGAWTPTPGAATWNGQGGAGISLRLDRGPSIGLDLTIGLRMPCGPVALESGGMEVETRCDAHGNLRAILPLASLLPHKTVHLLLRALPGTVLPIEATFLRLDRMWDRPTLALGETLSFALGGGGTATLRDGWSIAEGWGVWSVGRRSTLLISLDYTPVESLRLEIDAMVFTGVGGRMRVVGVALNGIPIGHARFQALHAQDGTAEARHSVVLPPYLIGSDREVRLTFELDNAGSPQLHGTMDDERHLGLGLRALTLGPA